MQAVSIIIPSKNEEKSIKRLIQEIWDTLIPYAPELKYEIVVVDDSTDNTAMIAKSVGARVIKGQGKGLGQAIIDGIKNARYDVVLNMDADGSHSPSAIPSLLKPIFEQGYDFVIGSRYVKGADFSKWALNRKIKSLVGVKLMQMVTGVRDSNSGFFAVRKNIVDVSKLNGKTWKIMLEILFKSKWVSKLEVPITFEDRIAGESKRSTRQVTKDALNIIRLLIYKYGRFINFAVVGGIGSLWYFSILYLLTEYGNLWYGLSAAIATFIAMANNYLINHYWTFRKVKQNNANLFKGWIKYLGNSLIGDGVDWCVLILLTEVFGVWYMLSAFLASGVACIIKYFIASKFIWGNKGKRATEADYEWVAYFKGLPWQKRWKRLLARITKEFAESDGNAGSVLDLGAGSSPLGLMINHKDYMAVDPNKNKMEFMRAKNLKDCTFYDGTLDTIKFTDNSKFDTILFIEVIEHLNGIDEAKRNLDKMCQLLKLNGKLIVATPNFEGFMGKTMDNLYGVFQKGAYKDEHKLKFGLNSLKALCADCGFKYVQSKIPSGADMVCLFRKV
jgi:dolichol-phosphate mannosyltransferase